jgi:hypothetical protein
VREELAGVFVEVYPATDHGYDKDYGSKGNNDAEVRAFWIFTIIGGGGWFAHMPLDAEMV